MRQYKAVLHGRAILVKRADVIPLEATVRSYLTGPQSLFVDSFAAGID